MTNLRWNNPPSDENHTYTWNGTVGKPTRWSFSWTDEHPDPLPYTITSSNEVVAVILEDRQYHTVSGNLHTITFLINPLREGKAHISCTIDDQTIIATIVIGTMFCYDSNGNQYTAPASCFEPIVIPEEFPTVAQMLDHWFAWATDSTGSEQGYIISNQGNAPAPRPDNLELYKSDKSGDNTSLPILYIYPPAADFHMPTTELHNYNGYKLNSENWALSNVDSIKEIYTEMKNKSAAIAWDPPFSATHVTCYVLNMGQISLPESDTSFTMTPVE